MEFDVFIKIIYEVIGKGNKSLHKFTVDLFEAAGDSYVNVDAVQNWFKSNKKNMSYKSRFNDRQFNDVRFNTFLKARTLGKWQTLQTAFNEEINKSKIESVINCTTDNQDKFIESIEWQFKTILHVPIIIENDQDYVANAENIELADIVLRKEKTKIAQNFYKMGLTIDKIAEGLTLSIEEVEKSLENN